MHTPGPWIAGNLDSGPLDGREDEICVTTKYGAVICTVWPMGEDFDKDEFPERDANACLIAAAPYLLAALELVAAEATNTPQAKDDPHLSFAYDKLSASSVLAVRAAINKAKGSEPCSTLSC